MSQVIYIHPDAPSKPMPGAVCNGCGVCCLAEPCPVGMLISRKRRGACTALVWNDEQQRYRCGALNAGQRWPRALRAPLQRWMQRFIAAGIGCDSEAQVSAPQDRPLVR